MAEQFFSVGENAVLCTLPEAEKLPAFFNCWTRKEAYIKAIGEGLSCPLDQFDVSLVPREPARLLRVASGRQDPSRWTLWNLDAIPDYVAALIAEGRDLHLKCWQWSQELTSSVGRA